MEIYVFETVITDLSEGKIFSQTQTFNLVSVIDTFQSFTWNRKYNGVGDFELYLPLTMENLNNLKIGNIICKDLWNSNKEGAIIENKVIEVDSNGIETLKVSGSFLTQLMNDRIVLSYSMNTAQTLNLSGTPDVVVNGLIHRQFYTPIEEYRKVACINYRSDIDETTLATLPSLTYSSRFNNLLTEVLEICKIGDIGIRAEFNQDDNKITFVEYVGADKTDSIVFSREYDNILSETYLENNSELKNSAYIGGEGEGSDREVTQINNVNSTYVGGLYRKELFVDARDLQRGKEGEENYLTYEDYMIVLQQRGLQALTEKVKIVSYEGTINAYSNYKYRIDYDLGDKITIRDKKLNLNLEARIVEIQEIYEEGKETINLTFGNSIPTIYDKIKNL